MRVYREFYNFCGNVKGKSLNLSVECLFLYEQGNPGGEQFPAKLQELPIPGEFLGNMQLRYTKTVQNLQIELLPLNGRALKYLEM